MNGSCSGGRCACTASMTSAVRISPSTSLALTNTSTNSTDYLWTLPDGTTSDSSEICYFPNDFEELTFTLLAKNSHIVKGTGLLNV